MFAHEKRLRAGFVVAVKQASLEVVNLRHGFMCTAGTLVLALQLEAEGFSIREEKGQLIVRPPKGVKIDPAMKRAIKGERNGMLRLIKYVEKIEQKQYPWEKA